MMKSIKLLDICRPKQWPTIATQDMTNKGYPVYGANGIIGYYSKYTHRNSTILITCRGASCGTINICLPYSYVNGNAMALDNLNSDVDINYLAYILKLRGFDDIITGSAQPQITRTSLSKIKIPLPPLATQKHIADILDAADALRRKTQQIVESYDELAQSLFLEMFGDPVSNPMGWKVVELQKVCNKITDGTHQSPMFQKEGIPFLFVSNVVNNTINFETSKYISEKDYDILTKSTPIEIGDLLYTSVGSYGNPAIVKTDVKFCFQRHIAHIKPNHAYINVVFLHSMMLSPLVKRQADKIAKGIAQKTMNLSEIKRINIFSPPLDLQNQFAEKIALIEQQRELAKQSLAESENLFNALLQKAFKGELVPEPQPAEQAV